MRLKFLNISLLLLVMMFVFASRAQEISLKAELDSTVILIGDQVTLNLNIEYPSQLEVFFPVPGDSLGKSVEIVERLKPDTIKIGNERIMMTQNFIVTSFDTGYHQIPPFYFRFNLNGMVDSIATNTTMLRVFTIPKLDSIMNELKGPIDIKQPYEAPVTIKEVAPWILGALLAAALLFLILYAIKRKKNNQPIFSLPRKPKEPAHIIALRELDRIKEEKKWQSGKVKEYYSEVTDTLREYIEDRFEINAMEQTSEETIAAFAKNKTLLDELTFRNLKRLLTNADLVKFAKYEPLPDDNNLALIDAYFFVNQTKIEIKQEAHIDADNNEGVEVLLK